MDKHFDPQYVNPDRSYDKSPLGAVVSFFRQGGIVFLILRLATFTSAVVIFVWAFSSPRFRDANGFLEGSFCLPVAISAALALWGLAVAGPLGRSASWLALALIGQSVALQMIDAGALVRYQHYKPLAKILNASPLLLIVLTTQALLVVFGLRSHWFHIKTWIGRTFKIWQLLGIGLVFVLSSAALSRELSVYAAELPFAALLQIVNLATILLAVLSLPAVASAWLSRKLELFFVHAEKASEVRVDLFAIVAAVWVVGIAAMLNFFSYEGHPHIADEVAYLYQARYFAAGLMHMQAPPVAEAFQIPLLSHDAVRWYSVFPPGWPLALAVGVSLGVAWLVNPLLAGINILLSYILIGKLYDRRTARIAVFLLCVSPWHVLMSMNFMSHTFTLTCALAASLMLLRAGKTGRARWAALAGVAVGFVALIRPLDGVILAALLGLCAIGFGGRRLKLSSIAALILGSVVVGAAVLPYNKLLTGDSTVLPVNAYFDKHYWPNSNAFGFGPERGAGWAIDAFPGHSPLEGLINANLNTFSINTELFGWSTGSLLLLALLVFAGAMRRSDHLMLAAIGLTFGAHFFYYFSGGPDFGARYWYLMLIPAVVLTVRGVRFLESKIESRQLASAYSNPAVMVAVLALSACALINYFPWRAIDKYHHYLGMRPDIRRLADQYSFGKSLVLVRGNNFPDYASAAVYNPVDLRADAPVYAWYRDAETRAQVLKAYPDRAVWIVDAPSLTDGGYRVVSGPLSPGVLETAGNEQP